MEKGEDEMLAIRNFGRKSLDELVDRLRDKNYLNVPGVDLSAYMNEAELESAVEEEEAESEADGRRSRGRKRRTRRGQRIINGLVRSGLRRA